MMILHNRLTNTAQALRHWSKSLFNEAKLHFHMANSVVQRLEVAQEARALSFAEAQLLKELKQSLRLGSSGAIPPQTKSRIINIREGDACTNGVREI
jgi:hypothetical protein